MAFCKQNIIGNICTRFLRYDNDFYAYFKGFYKRFLSEIDCWFVPIYKLYSCHVSYSLRIRHITSNCFVHYIVSSSLTTIRTGPAWWWWFSLRIIYNEGLYPSSRDIIRLMKILSAFAVISALRATLSLRFGLPRVFP
jgi:hypothetical protein